MEKKLKILFDVEIVNDETNLELENGFGQLAYSYQACGGGGGCGGCGGCGGGCGGGRYTEKAKRMN